MTRPMTACFHRISLTLIISVVICATVSAYQYRKGGDVYLTGDFQEDLFVMGSTLNFDGSIVGDILAAAYGITIDGSVDGNVLAAGQKVTINGEIRRSLRCAGQNVNITSKIDGDVVIFAADATLTDDAIIGRDISIHSGGAFLDGVVTGKAYVSAGTVTIAGRIDGDVTILADRISVTPDAVIGGELNYTSKNKASIASDAQIAGDVKWKKKSRSYESSESSGLIPRPFGLLWSLVFFIGSLILGVVMILIRRDRVADVIGEIKKNAVLDGLIGLGLIVAVPLVLIMVCITFVGIPVAIAGLAVYAIVFLIAKILVGMTIGLLLLGLLKKEGPVSLGWALLVGMIVLTIGFKIPVIGWLIYFLAWAVGAGAITMQLFKKQAADRLTS